jgi:hypothetical protein
MLPDPNCEIIVPAKMVSYDRIRFAATQPPYAVDAGLRVPGIAS